MITREQALLNKLKSKKAVSEAQAQNTKGKNSERNANTNRNMIKKEEALSFIPIATNKTQSKNKAPKTKPDVVLQISGLKQTKSLVPMSERTMTRPPSHPFLPNSKPISSQRLNNTARLNYRFERTIRDYVLPRTSSNLSSNSHAFSQNTTRNPNAFNISNGVLVPSANSSFHFQPTYYTAQKSKVVKFDTDLKNALSHIASHNVGTPSPVKNTPISTAAATFTPLSHFSSVKSLKIDLSDFTNQQQQQQSLTPPPHPRILSHNHI